MITVIPVTLRIAAPYMTRSSEPGAFGVDAALARDGKRQLIIPGSHVTGKIAQSIRDLSRLLAGTDLGLAYNRDLKELLAEDAQAIADIDVSGREDRRNLTASDFVLKTGLALHGTRTRIARENATLTVAEGMMQVLEQPFHPGTLLEFEGDLRFSGEPDSNRLHRIGKALNYVVQFGGLRTIGFGANKGALVGEPKRSGSIFNIPAATRSLQLVLRFNDAFCTGESRNDPNTYTSALHVPGGAIKGAIAKQVLAGCGLKGYLDDNQANLTGRDLKILANSFSAIRVQHAMPVPKGGIQARRPPVLPASLAAIEKDGSVCIVDLAGLAEPANPVVIEGQGPISLFDWKNRQLEAAVEAFGFHEPPGRQLRIRTQIDETRRASMTNRLFGVEYTRNDTHDFIAQIDLPDLEHSKSIIDGLRTVLSNGLAGIGRGGAHADVSLSAMEERRPIPDSDRVVIVLQTAALLRSPSTFGNDLRSDYENALREIGLPANWMLKAVFVEEQLAGGGFMRNRLKVPNRYAPWLLTKPGAVFVLQRGQEGVPLPASWLERGLDVPGSVLGFHGLAGEDRIYRFCPYLPENGYGEISHGAALHDGRSSHIVLAPVTLGLAVDEVRALGGGR